MSHIIRVRFWTGYTVVDGNNPFTIQSHPVSNHVQSEQGPTKDYLDLTDHLGYIPSELAYTRNNHPLFGGIHTVKIYSGPMNDYLATHYVEPSRRCFRLHSP